jgi:hypothetical protein
MTLYTKVCVVLLTSRSTWCNIVPEVQSASIVPEVLLMCLEYVLGVCEIYTSRYVYNMKLPYGRYALNYVLHLCTLYRRNRLSRAASLTYPSRE